MWENIIIGSGFAFAAVVQPGPLQAFLLSRVLAAWQEHPTRAVALVGAFYGTMVLGLTAFIATAGTVRFLGPARQRRLTVVSGVVLAGLGLFLLGQGLAQFPDN